MNRKGTGTRPRCIWLSRHAPTVNQRIALACYDLCQVSERFDDGNEAWRAALRAAGFRLPALVVAVLPPDMLRTLTVRASIYRVPVVKAAMALDEQGGWQWHGVWRQLLVTDGKHQWQDWSPERGY